MLRRGSSLALGIAILALLAGCGGSDSNSGSETSSATSGGDSGSTATAGDLGPGITTNDLPPFKPSDKAGEKPDLPKVVAFAQDNNRELEQLMARSLEEGASDAGLDYKSANSGGDPQKQVENMEQFLIQGVSAMVTLPVDPEAQAPAMLKAIGEGVMMDATVFGPGTSQVDAPQYEGGKVLAEHAAEFIESDLGGKANVVILNQDSIEAIRPRFEAMREVFAKMPGVKIVADVEPEATDTEHGFQTMTTVLQKEPEVNVVLGADAVVAGALAALEAAHKADPAKLFLGGVDCENQALAKIAEEGAYKICVGTHPSIFGYAWGRYAGDWVEGKSVPQGISVLALPVTNAAEVAEYKKDQDDPAAVFDDPKQLAKYLALYGNISYETRDQYLANTWLAPGHEAEGG